MGRAGRRYAAAMRAVVRRLPFGLSRIVAPTFLGFVLINLTTFALDLAMLSLLHGALGLRLGLAVTVSYAAALTTSYAMNRVLNFRSRAPVGRQFGGYVVVVVVNYLLCVLGVTAGLTAAGLDYRVARVAAGLVEAGFMYVAMRHLVFRDARAKDLQRDHTHNSDPVHRRREGSSV